jgi:MFS family permease
MKVMSSKAAPRRPGAHAWFALGLLTVIYASSYADRYLVASLSESLKTAFALSDSFLGLLMGPAFALLFTLAAIPIARLADRRPRVTIIAVGCLVWSAFTALSGLATSGAMLALMRIGVGIGEAAFIAPAYSILADRFPPERRGMAFGILALGLYIGQVGGYVGGPVLEAALGSWRAAFLTLGLAGCGLAVLVRLTVAEPERTIPPGERHSLIRVAALLWRQPAYVFANAGMAFGTFSGLAFGMWGPTLFTRAYAIPPAEASARFGLAFGPAGLIGALLFGFVADRLTARDRRWPLRLAGLSLMAATLAILGVTFAPTIHIATLLAVPAGVLGGGWSVGVMAALQNMLPQRIRATGTALFILLTTLIGMVFGPFVVGAISDAIGTSDAASLRAALGLCIVVGLPAGIALWAASRSVERAGIALAAGVETLGR